MEVYVNRDCKHEWAFGGRGVGGHFKVGREEERAGKQGVTFMVQLTN